MFITLEGIEGCGKTTLLKRLGEHLRSQGKSVCVTHEPGDSSLGEHLRKLLLSPKYKLTSTSELFLFLADRAQHIVECIQPACATGQVVLCDRYIDSTMVYQGYGRGFDIDQLWAMNMFAAQNLLPDKTIVLDMEPEKAVVRARKRNTIIEKGEEGRFEAEDMDFHKCIREGFLHWAAQNPQRMFVLDADTTQDKIFQQACEILCIN